MESRRFTRVLATVAQQPEGPMAERLCRAAEAHLGATGIGLCMAAADDLFEPVFSTQGGHTGETIHADVGEGPAYTAHRTAMPVLVPDVATDTRWPAFSLSAAAEELGSVFSFPLRRGAISLGVLTLYRTSPGGLDDEHLADALVFAGLGLDLLLDLQADRPQDEVGHLFSDGRADTASIHQAAGMVSVQIGVDVGSALAAIRAHAFTRDRTLHDVADDIVARRLRLDGSSLGGYQAE